MPLGSNLATPRGSIVSIDLQLEKLKKIRNWVGGLMAQGFGADCIKIVVSMATDRSHTLTMGKTKKIFISETTRPTALIFGM